MFQFLFIELILCFCVIMCWKYVLLHCKPDRTNIRKNKCVGYLLYSPWRRWWREADNFL